MNNRCERGCDEDGTRCNIRHPYEGTSCIGYTLTGCFDGFHLYCDLGTYVVNDCAAQGLECVEINGEGACLSPCTQAEYEAATTQSVCDEDAYLTVHRCNQFSENGYYWEYVDRSRCEHGCNAGKDACMTVHADEGKNCSNDPDAENYYAAKCEGSLHLYCGGYRNEVVAKDCGELSCDDGFGCYESCETAGEVHYSCVEDTDGEVTYGYDLVSLTCVADPEYHINYWEWDYVEYCDGATSCTQGKDSCY